ncbi:probable protein phosphatase 2C 40 [Euphorbia lathyris]|uniref:probable protein phosphatase 2C 40 n=1 Tax=Euphorbia lathyris TaxID=212925 RepID=UPI003313D38E
MRGSRLGNPEEEIKISFGYQCNGQTDNSGMLSNGYESLSSTKITRNSSFSCLSGAAISANATLANTNICNGVIGAEILPSWDSPNSFRKVPSSPNLSRLDMLSSSLQSSMSYLSCSPSSPSPPEHDSYLFKSASDSPRTEGFLNGIEVQVAGGAAGEDRVQAVCSEENGWLFCGIYDGFNGRDAADFLAGTLYETIVFHINSLDWDPKQDGIIASHGLCLDGSIQYALQPDSSGVQSDSFRDEVLESLQKALSQAENDFLNMVEQEMEDRPDLVSVGSCVLVVFLYGADLYILNLGDSRAVLATYDEVNGPELLKAVQLTDSHTVDNEVERSRVLNEHPDDPATVTGGKVKGKLKVTRAFGVGYLKKKKLNDALMGILQVQNLRSPPYVSTEPSMKMHRISKSDQFLIVASDGLFDFFNNDEAVKLVRSYILSNPAGDPAKFVLEQLMVRAAECAGFTKEELMSVPAGRRRKYHDDVTVVVIVLGTNQRTSKASTYM